MACQQAVCEQSNHCGTYLLSTQQIVIVECIHLTNATKGPVKSTTRVFQRVMVAFYYALGVCDSFRYST